VSSVKALGRDILAETLFASGISRPGRVCRNKLLVLTFHRVLPEELKARYPLRGLVVTPRELDWVLRQLLPEFEIFAVSDAWQRFRSARASKPLLAISFDDGQVDNLQYGAPVLQDLGIKATFYLPSDYIGQSGLLWHDEAAFAWQALQSSQSMGDAISMFGDLGLHAGLSVQAFMAVLKRLEPEIRARVIRELLERSNFVVPEWARLMTWAEAAELSRAGHEIGSHGCSHALLPQLDRDAQKREIEQSKQVIAAALGTSVRSLCYPNGSYDGTTLELAAAAGYENAVTTKWGVNASSVSEYELLRCDMDAARLLDRRGSLSPARLALRLSGLQPGL
jgi:peptidoglycan/xylan/chitin deacetylase (PgdA/CDA1 family)